MVQGLSLSPSEFISETTASNWHFLGIPRKDLDPEHMIMNNLQYELHINFDKTKKS